MLNKVLVVGNPANTNCLIAAKSAPSIPKENFSCLTRLDHNRARSQVGSSVLGKTERKFERYLVDGSFCMPDLLTQK